MTFSLALLLTTTFTSHSVQAQSQTGEDIWVVCSTYDGSLYVTPPVSIKEADLPALNKRFRELASSVGNSPECETYSALSEVDENDKAGSFYFSTITGQREKLRIEVKAFPNLPDDWGQTSSAGKPFFCVAHMNPQDGRGIESAYSSIMLGSPDDKNELQQSFYEAAKAAGTLNDRPDHRFSGCYFLDDADKATAARDTWNEGFRRSPGDPKYYAGELRWDGGGLASPLPSEEAKTTAQEEPTTAAVATKAEVSPAAEPAKPKYVEVTGPDGVTIRLTPEVAARNEAAANEYKRKMQEHSEAVARVEAEKQAMATKRAEILAKAAEEKREYERRLAEHAAQVSAQKAAVAHREAGKGQTKGGTEGILQAYGAFSETRDAALASLTSRSANLPELFNIQCSESTGGFKKSWACWGSYRQNMTRSSVSKQ